MRLDLKKEPLYPSISKPGIFLYDMDDEIQWEEYTNILDTEIDRYTFTLGTWEEHRAQNRKIRVFENNYVDKALIGIGDDILPTEEKPTSPPVGFVPNTVENLKAVITNGFDTKPPDESWRVHSVTEHGPGRYEPMFGLYGYDGLNDNEHKFKLIGAFLDLNNSDSGYYYVNVNHNGGKASGHHVSYGPTRDNYLSSQNHWIDPDSDFYVGTNALEIGPEDFNVPSSYKEKNLYVITYPYVGYGHEGEAAGLVWENYRVKKRTGFDDYKKLNVIDDITWHKSTDNDPEGKYIEFPDDTHPEFKFRRGSDIFDDVVSNPFRPLEIDPEIHLAGWWKVKGITLRKANITFGETPGGAARKVGRAIKNWVSDRVSPGGIRNNGNPMEVVYEWHPNLHKDARFSKVGSYSPEAQWRWVKVGPFASGEGMEVDGVKSDFDWRPNEYLLSPGQIRKPLNSYFGVAFSSTDNDPNIGADVPTDLDDKGLLIYHKTKTLNYFNTSAPLKIFFGVQQFDVDVRNDENGVSFESNVLKYHVVQWGDEEERLSSEEILTTEFFKLYDQDENTFDRSQAKRLLQIVRDAKYFRKNGTMDLTEHTYLTPGVKSIKTVVFRLSNGEDYILETILINTNIVINDPQEELQNFSIFGANDFTTLPLSVKTNDLIIGGIDEESEYIKTLKTVKRDSLFTGEDFLEKNYTNQFFEKFKEGSYGENNSNIDLSTMRILNRPLDLYHFITNNIFEKMEIVNNQYGLQGISLPTDSLATDILIDDNSCLVELNPKDSIHYTIQNTGQSDAVGIMIGDYTLDKDEELPLERTNEMEIPKIEDKKDKQAY